MKILHLSTSDLDGGGSVVTYRLHKALLNSNINSKMLVFDKFSRDDDSIICKSSNLDKIISIIKNTIIFQLRKLFKINHAGTISLNLFPSNILKKINNVDHDIIHLHSINKELLSVNQITKISKPVIWTFMDMWPICGAEHYSETDQYKNGYDKSKIFDLFHYTWKRKKKFSKNIKIVCLSTWLTKKVKESFLYKNFSVHTIPPCIDTNIWKGIKKETARNLLGYNLDEKILLFSAANGTSDGRKGFDILIESLKNSNFIKDNCRLLVIGKISDKDKSKIPIKYENFLIKSTDNHLIFRIIYSASDLLIIPSRLEAFGQTIIEAGSCETPSIGFKNTGVKDAIQHKISGYLSEKNSTDLLDGINWCFREIKEKNNTIGKNARRFVEENFSEEIISRKYIDLYKEILKKG